MTTNTRHHHSSAAPVAHLRVVDADLAEEGDEQVLLQEPDEDNGEGGSIDPNPKLSTNEEAEDLGAGLRAQCEGLEPKRDHVFMNDTLILIHLWPEQDIVELLDPDEGSLAIGKRARFAAQRSVVFYPHYVERWSQAAWDVWNDDELFAELLMHEEDDHDGDGNDGDDSDDHDSDGNDCAWVV